MVFEERVVDLPELGVSRVGARRGVVGDGHPAQHLDPLGNKVVAVIGGILDTFVEWFCVEKLHDDEGPPAPAEDLVDPWNGDGRVVHALCPTSCKHLRLSLSLPAGIAKLDPDQGTLRWMGKVWAKRVASARLQELFLRHRLGILFGLCVVVAGLCVSRTRPSGPLSRFHVYYGRETRFVDATRAQAGNANAGYLTLPPRKYQSKYREKAKGHTSRTVW
jgi:hypothetical protein